MADGDADGLIDVPALERFLAERVPGDDAPLDCERHVVGSSNVTYYVTRGSQEWVLRRPPRGPLLPTAHDVLREHRYIAALQGQARVPTPVVACDDESIIGAPFYLMERCFGAMLRDGIPEVYDTPAGRRRVAEDLVITLVELHAVDWEAVGLRGRGSGYLERQMRRWIGQWELTRPQTRDLPGLEEIVAWLRARIPEDAGATVVHGDYRLDNVMFGAEEPRVVAIFDWEMATVGDPLADVGWLLSYWGDPGDPPPSAGVGSASAAERARGLPRPRGAHRHVRGGERPLDAARGLLPRVRGVQAGDHPGGALHAAAAGDGGEPRQRALRVVRAGAGGARSAADGGGRELGSPLLRE